MSTPSRWPLPPDGIRFVAPNFIYEFMRTHALTKSCFPSAMGYYPMAKGHAMSRQTHDDHLLIYCVDGEGELEAQTENTPVYSWEVKAGDILILEQDTAHRYRASHDNPWSIFWVHFSGEQSRDYINELKPYLASLVVNIGHSSAVLASFKSLLSVRNTGYSESAIIHAANQLRQLLTLLPLERQAIDAPQGQGFNLDTIQALMWENLAGSLDLAQLADSANLSKFHFCKKYKKLTGYSPIKHFIHMKMEHACALLDTTHLGINSIAGELGYDDAMYFSRIFKRTIGLSPKVYREKH